MSRQARRKTTIHLLERGEGWAVIDKPAGLACSPSRDQTNAERSWPLIDRLRELLAAPEIMLVHRLDRDTSGCLLVATEPEIHRALSIAFQRREVEKRYLGLAVGEPLAASGTIEAPLERDPRGGSRMRIAGPQARHAKPSKTGWRRLVRFRGFTLLELEPHTGRQHQLRVHLRHMGCPLAVDPLYASAEPLLLSRIKRRYRPSRRRPEAPLCSRTPLHAWKLRFRDPKTGALRRVRAPLPSDLRRLVRTLLRHARPRPGVDVLSDIS